MVALLTLAGIPLLLAAALTGSAPGDLPAQRAMPVSNESQTCIDCHDQYTPGIVADWRSSRHAITIPGDALKNTPLQRRISADNVAPPLDSVVVGCYECHSLNVQTHADRMDHFGYAISVVVSPADCKTCHPVEAEQYAAGKKAHALDNLQKNPVYHALVETATGMRTAHGKELSRGISSNNAKNGTCYGCHGTRVEVRGTQTITTDGGDVTVPVLTNWPNQGVGRINPDGSAGSCTSCHPRHAFSIEVARTPATCGQCHLEPDIPTYNIYKESKHGNIEEALHHRWNWEAVPWTVGKDFTAPTCATCHNSLLTNPAGTVIAQRSHDFGTRTWVRLFGLIYSHPQPISGKTYELKNADGLPLPTTFSGVPATSFLIGTDEQAKRKDAMRAVCLACHSTPWVDGHFAALDTSIAEADGMVRAATQMLGAMWEQKMADRKNPFDESVEQQWVRQWLFYGNSVRYAAAMSGQDYATFKNGWWELNANLQRIHETLNAGRKK
jgi:hydroxylamine dehydrogenase